MRPWLLLPLLLLGCGSPAQKQAAMRLESAAFAPGAAIPARYSCDGANLSPPLRWSRPPQGTRSLALILDDPDAPGGTFGHWAIYDLVPDLTALADDAASHAPAGARQAHNDFGGPGYAGPCPPEGSGPHHYRFRILALNVASLLARENEKVAAVAQSAEPHVLAVGELTGTYQRR